MRHCEPNGISPTNRTGEPREAPQDSWAHEFRRIIDLVSQVLVRDELEAPVFSGRFAPGHAVPRG